jgi:acetyl-CoA carboxylase biotin carboxyl carrier protein
MRKGGKSHMELDDLLKLIDHVSKSKLDDFCYETGEIKLRLKKNAAKEIVVQQKEVKNAASEFAIDADISKKTDEASSDKYIDSPLVGIFYTAPGEGEAPFVSVGDRVKKGQTLGIVEAMKLMHEITCEQNGIVKEICAQNGDAVEYGQKLFIIEEA